MEIDTEGFVHLQKETGVIEEEQLIEVEASLPRKTKEVKVDLKASNS